MHRIHRSVSLAGAVALVFALTGCPDTDDDSAQCGNGRQEVGESCDDGNTVDGDGCSSTCELEGFCGNGIREPGEECDDGNYATGDGCDDKCEVEQGCGNGLLDVGEQCDDDNLINGDGCSNLCTDEEAGAVCGNGIWETGEGCDDGNTDDGDGCSADCQREDGCGDGVQDPGEQCDDGNNVNGDGCRYDCRQEFVCGDNICDTANAESCEYCPHDCCPDCGNGALDTDEGCDDGNNVSGDGCSAGCTDEDGTATCGNGIWEVGEGCDDGNTDPGDGCDGSCDPEYTRGDGECDTGNGENCVNSPADCCPDCGTNNQIDPGEQCDGNEFGGLTCEDFCYTGGTLTCTSSCQIDKSSCTGTLPTCGDDTAGCDEECDGDDLRSMTCGSLGFGGGTLGCSATTCTFDVSSCTDRLWYLNEGFEGSGTPFGWRLAGMWEIGSPSGSLGPAAAHGGNRCVGTRIAGEYDDQGLYSVDYIESPRVDLRSATNPRMRFYRWLDSQADYDGGNLWISTDGGLSFTLVPTAQLDPPYDHDPVVQRPAWTGQFGTDGWTPVIVNLQPWAGQQIVLRWAFASDSADSAYGGLYIDDVLITEAANLPVEITNQSPLPTAVTDHGYSVEMRATGGSSTYNWTLTPVTNAGWLSIDSSTGVLSGTPTSSEIGTVTVTIRCEESTNATNFDEETFNFEVMDALFYEDFEGTAPGGWTLPAALLSPSWEWGAPSAVGPADAYAGTQCIGTNLSGVLDPTACFGMGGGGCDAVSPYVDLTGTTNPTLTFWQYVEFDSGSGGYVVVDASGIGETVISNPTPAYTGTTAGLPPFLPGSPAWVGDLSAQGWHQVTIDLSPFIGEQVSIIFRVETNMQATVGQPGWYVDDVVIVD